MIPVSLGNKRLNLLSFSDYQPVLACDHFYWDSDKVNNRVIFFTTNKMPISLKALDFPFHFHLIPVSLGNTGRNLLSFSECQPVWVKPLFVPVCSLHYFTDRTYHNCAFIKYKQPSSPAWTHQPDVCEIQVFRNFFLVDLRHESDDVFRFLYLSLHQQPPRRLGNKARKQARQLLIFL